MVSKDSTKAEKQLSVILGELDKYQYESNGDSFTVKTEDGELLTDAHKNAVSFEDLVKRVTSDYFEFAEKEDGDNGGKGKGATGNGNEFGAGKFKNIQVPQTPEELKAAVRGAKSPEEAKAISEAYLEANKD